MLGTYIRDVNSPLDSPQIGYRHRWGFLCYSTKQQLDKQSSCLWFNSSSVNAAYMGSINWVGVSSGNGLSPVRRQAMTWTKADLLSTGPLTTNFCEIQIKIQSVAFMKMHLKMSSAKWRPFLSRGKWVKIPWCAYYITGMVPVWTKELQPLWPLLLTWFNFNPSMDK